MAVKKTIKSEVKTIEENVKMEIDNGLPEGHVYLVKTINNDGKLQDIVDTSKVIKTHLTKEEAVAFLGGRDPKDYFYLGKVPVYMKRNLGFLLDDDSEQRMIVDSIFKDLEDRSNILIFANTDGNKHTLLIPKQYSAVEITDGEFTSPAYVCDPRVIVYTGFGRTGHYSPDVFKKDVERVAHSIKVVLQKRMF